MFGNLLKSIGGSFLSKVASKLLTKVPILNKIATKALEIMNMLPLTKLRNWVKEKLGVDIKDLLKLTPMAPVATVMEAQDLLAAAVKKDGAPKRGTPAWSEWFNGSRAVAYDQYKKQLSAAA